MVLGAACTHVASDLDPLTVAPVPDLAVVRRFTRFRIAGRPHGHPDGPLSGGGRWYGVGPVSLVVLCRDRELERLPHRPVVPRLRVLGRSRQHLLQPGTERVGVPGDRLGVRQPYLGTGRRRGWWGGGVGGGGAGAGAGSTRLGSGCRAVPSPCVTISAATTQVVVTTPATVAA